MHHGVVLLTQRSQQSDSDTCDFSLEQILEPLLQRVLPSLALAETNTRAAHAERVVIAALSTFGKSKDLQGNHSSETYPLHGVDIQ